MPEIRQYPLLASGGQNLSIPAGARILPARWHADRPGLHALVEPTPPVVWRRISIYPTGASLPFAPRRAHLATCETPAGDLLHIFEDEPQRIL